MGHIIPLRGFNPIMGKSCFIAPTATLIGDVEMGDRCSVWFNAILRGDVGAIRIGNDCNIQDGALLHATFGLSSCQLGDRVSIGHLAIIHGAIIDSDVLVGMGAIIMDNARVHSRVIVAAGSVILANQELESGYIYAGNPAKKVKKVSDSPAEKYIELTPKAYQEYVKWYLDKEGTGEAE